MFLFHANGHLGCTFGGFTPFVQMGAVFMTCFFMISGFSLHYTSRDKSFMEMPEMVQFWKKRLSGIIPLYWFVGICYMFFLGKESIQENIILIPIELVGIQSVFTSLFGVSHNGGTWFISCLLICYFIFPFIQNIVKQIDIKGLFIFLIICASILLYSPLVVKSFSLSNIYSNPFFRMLEFIIGSIIGECYKRREELPKFNFLFKWKLIIVEFVLMVLLVTIAVKMQLGVGNYMLYNWIVLPIFILLIYGLAGVKVTMIRRDILIYCSKISYAFFLAQYFTWPIARKTMAIMRSDLNWLRVVLSFVICMCLSVVLYEVVEKPCNKLLKYFMRGEII